MYDMKVEDLLGENTGESGDSNLLTVTAMGNSGFLEDLLRAGMDPDVGDAKGRTALVSEQKRIKLNSDPMSRRVDLDASALSNATRSTLRRPRDTRTACWCCSSTRATSTLKVITSRSPSRAFQSDGNTNILVCP
jgi:hypothetical protein